MARKKWTPQTEITDSLLRFREKRKWQLNYRRYVLERMPCEGYARYFGLDIETLRSWFETQFTGGQDWDNFGKAWQFYHLVPATYFDFSLGEDLLLCWSYINIGIESLDPDLPDTKIDALAVREYFQQLYKSTGLDLCQKMLARLAAIETQTQYPGATREFILRNSSTLADIASLSQEELLRVNQGSPLKEVLLEREILKKFG